jgi:hypothetical protein
MKYKSQTQRRLTKSLNKYVNLVNKLNILLLEEEAKQKIT